MYELDGISWLIIFCGLGLAASVARTLSTTKCHSTSYIIWLKAQSQNICDQVEVIRIQGVYTFCSPTIDARIYSYFPQFLLGQKTLQVATQTKGKTNTELCNTTVLWNDNKSTVIKTFQTVTIFRSYNLQMDNPHFSDIDDESANNCLNPRDRKGSCLILMKIQW